MFEDTKAFSGFSVDDIPRAKDFYGETLGLRVSEENGMLTLHIAGDRPTLVYPKPDHVPATFTILNFPVDDIDVAVDDLVALRRGVRALRGRRREGDHAGPGPAHRLVQGPRRQHPLGHPTRLKLPAGPSWPERVAVRP